VLGAWGAGTHAVGGGGTLTAASAAAALSAVADDVPTGVEGQGDLPPPIPPPPVRSRGSPRLRLSVALDLDTCRFVVAHAAGCSTVRTGWLGHGRPGCLPNSHSDSVDGSRVDRGHRCYLPHHSQPWYTHLCSPSFFLSSFVHHGGEWLVSSYHICGCHRHSRLFSHSRCSCRSFFGPQSSFYSSFYH
jgi:hypothetical protein